MNIPYWVLLVATCILAISRITFASELLTCKLPRYIAMQISKNETANLYESDLTVQLESDNFILTTYRDTNAVSILATNVVVTYNGFMLIENEDSTLRTSPVPQIISKTYTDRITGVAQREVSKSSDIDGCRIVLLSTEMERAGASGRIANEIRRLAEACIELEFCQKIGTMNPQFIASLPDKNTSNVLLACPEPLVVLTEGCETQYNTDNVQPIINKAVDVGLNQITETLRATNGGTFPISDVDQRFSIGSSIFKTNGYFKAINGTFRDLTTIHRLSDVTIAHDRMKVIVACEFGLEIADLNFPHYKLKYGVIKVGGMLEGTVNNTAIAVRVAVDYNRQPCRLSMEHLKVTELGKINIKFTGLGPLNWMVTKLLNWITIKWREDIVVTLEEQLIASVEEKLLSLNCEKYRP